jgi:hypothetical protein
VKEGNINDCEAAIRSINADTYVQNTISMVLHASNRSLIYILGLPLITFVLTLKVRSRLKTKLGGDRIADVSSRAYDNLIVIETIVFRYVLRLSGMMFVGMHRSFKDHSSSVLVFHCRQGSEAGLGQPQT